jgi:hypothetical protein
LTLTVIFFKVLKEEKKKLLLKRHGACFARMMAGHIGWRYRPFLFTAQLTTSTLAVMITALTPCTQL